MSDPLLIIWQWDAEDGVMRPTSPYQMEKAEKAFKHGQRYTLTEWHETSDKSRAFFFVNLKEIWQTLPPNLEREFPNFEIFRKHGLIKKGYADMERLVCGSKKEAERVAAFIGRGDPYCIVTVEDAVVTKFTAHSMQGRSMSQKTFTEAAGKVLDWASDLVGTTKEQVEPSA